MSERTGGAPGLDGSGVGSTSTLATDSGEEEGARADTLQVREGKVVEGRAPAATVMSNEEGEEAEGGQR
jgi:hypothetical protein